VPSAGAYRLALVAGETSGDLLAGLLLQGCRSRWPELHTAGIGGPAMTAQGFDAWWPSEKLAVRGYVEVLRHYREIVGIREQLKQRLLAAPPDLFVGVDAPDFNLDLEAGLKARGIKTLHFVCPAIWAWRAERVHKIRASVDHVLCIFPMEPALLAQHGIASTYVGHPLANVIPLVPDKAAARARLGLRDQDTVVALLPGSRRAEIAHLAERFLKAGALLQREKPGLKLILPAVPALLDQINDVVSRCGMRDAVQVVKGRSHDVMAACDVTLIASGTATLEAALFKRPMVIAYHMPWLSWQITQRKRLQPWVGLPNILSGEFVVPERLQDEARPEMLARDVLDWLDAPEKMGALQQRFTALHHELQRDTAQLATDAIEHLLEG
jgi:lipid-A-disaccharide synthase